MYLKNHLKNMTWKELGRAVHKKLLLFKKTFGKFYLQEVYESLVHYRSRNYPKINHQNAKIMLYGQIEERRILL